MKIKKLIKQLKALQKEHGNIPVHVWADHGQDCSVVQSVGMEPIDSEGDPVHPDDFSSYKEGELKNTVIISD